MLGSDAYMIFDVGKTQKKLLIYNNDHSLLHEESTRLPTTKDEDGFEADDLGLIASWIREKITQRANDPALKICGVNFASYGASCVFVDESFRQLTPLYNYLKPADPRTLDSFYSLFGNADTFSFETSSPALGMLNTGFQIFRLKKERPDIFSRMKYALHLPQYLSALVSGLYFSELSSIGCHTGMWNFRNHQYHRWLEKEGIIKKLAPITQIASSRCGSMEVGVGLHDSSAALLPFLHMQKEPFIFLSTGTWAITFNAFDTEPLTPDELANDVLVYMLPDGRPVKASRCLLGKVHDERCEQIVADYSMQSGFYNSLRWDEELYQIITGKVVSGWENRSNGVESYYVMMDGLIKQLRIAFERVNNGRFSKVYVDGGFARNPVFMTMLERSLVDKELITAAVPESTALGALIQLRNHNNS